MCPDITSCGLLNNTSPAMWLMVEEMSWASLKHALISKCNSMVTCTQSSWDISYGKLMSWQLVYGYRDRWFSALPSSKMSPLMWPWTSAGDCLSCQNVEKNLWTKGSSSRDHEKPLYLLFKTDFFWRKDSHSELTDIDNRWLLSMRLNIRWGLVHKAFLIRDLIIWNGEGDPQPPHHQPTHAHFPTKLHNASAPPLSGGDGWMFFCAFWSFC